MSISDAMEETRKQEEAFAARNKAKMGEYDNPGEGCPNCGRHRVMKGEDGKHRCEKCQWCLEDNVYDSEFLEYMR